MEQCAVGSIRSRPETSKLYFDFRYRNKRCREQTNLTDTQANRRKLEKMLERIEAEIVLGSFEYSRYFPNSKLAKEFSIPVQGSSRGTNNLPSFKDFSEIWYDEMKGSWRVSYRRTIRPILDNRLFHFFGELNVAEIKKADLLTFRASLSKESGRNKKGLSASHINRHMKVMRMILTEAADRFEFTSPFQNIKPLKIQKTDIDPFTLDEINLILKTVRQDYRNYYTVRFFTGMRTGEIDGLKWRYVDFNRRQILIRETIVLGQTEYTKTDGSQREIDMSQPVYDALKFQYQRTGNQEYVFSTNAGTPLSHNNVTKRIWYPLLRYLDLRKRRPYQTRHTAATLWLAAGENPEWIARQMGHTTTEMLFRVYSRYVPNLTRSDGSAIENLIAQNFSFNNKEDDADES